MNSNQSVAVGGGLSLSKTELVILALIGALILYLYYPILYQTALICYEDEDYSHGLILPFVSAYIFWEKRKEFQALLANPLGHKIGFSVIGFLVLLLGAATYFIGGIASILFASWFSFFATLVGVMMLVLGAKRSLPFLPAVLLVFMAKPIPDSLVPRLFFPLQVFAAQVSAKVLDMLNVPVYLMGNIIEIPSMRLMVEEACSGIRSLMALITVGIIVILIIPMKTWAKFFILALSVATAILLNIVRVALTGVLAHFYDPAAATGFFHTFSGMIVFVVGLMILYGIASLLSTDRRKKTA